MRRVMLALVPMCMLLAACEVTPDANPQTFQTPEQTLASRWAGQMRAWKEAALELLRIQRPDVAASAAEDFAIAVRIDSMQERIDLSPIESQLKARPESSNEVLSDFLRAQMAKLDQQRLARLPLEEIKPKLKVIPASEQKRREFNAMTPEAGGVLATLIAPEVYRIAVIEWSPGQFSPVTQRALDSWRIAFSELERAALDNTAREVSGDPFETISFGTAGRVGRLRPNVNPGLVLAPGFLKLVREKWRSDDDLVVLLGSAENIQFMESRNRAMLDTMYPRWRDSFDRAGGPMSAQPLLLNNYGLAVMKYDPPVRIFTTTTQPVGNLAGNPLQQLQSPQSRMPATRPAAPQALPRPLAKPYIAR